MSVDVILNALEKVRPYGKNAWRAVCPSCGGKNNSKLSIKDSGGGVTLVHCFGVAQLIRVVGAIGLELSDLMPPKESSGRPLRNALSREAAGTLGPELNVAWVLLNDISKGRQISAGDRKRAGECARKVANLLVEMRL